MYGYEYRQKFYEGDTMKLNYKQLKEAQEVEEVICLAVLIAGAILQHDATIDDSRDYYSNRLSEECAACPMFTKCLAVIINE